MAKKEHLDILKQGVEVWNRWREEHLDSHPDLSMAKLDGFNLRSVDLSESNLSEIYLSRADLSNADLSRADLSNADLSRADLSNADLSNADLSGANLIRAIIVETNLSGAILTNCLIYGASVWDVQLEGTAQANLVITLPSHPNITVDNLEIAQFTYLLLNSRKVRDVINTIATNVVLILGRFSEKRKAILEAIREELRKQNYVPVLFDFETPSSRDFTETIMTLASMSRFIIADLSDPSSLPQELYAIVPTLSVPVQPLLQASEKNAYSLLADISRYPWVLPVYQYKDLITLSASLKEKVIMPAEQKAKELEEFKK